MFSVHIALIPMVYDIVYFKSNDSLFRQFSLIERNAKNMQNLPTLGLPQILNTYFYKRF